MHPWDSYIGRNEGQHPHFPHILYDRIQAEIEYIKQTMSTESSSLPTTSAHSDPSPPQSHQSSPESSSEPPQTITMSDNQATAHSQDDLQSGSKSPDASDPSSSSSSSGEPTLVKGSHSASAERIEADSGSKSMDYTNNNNSSTGISGSNNSNAQSLSVPGNGSTTEKGGKTSQRKNVQWAASTKGEGPMRGDPGPSSSAYVPNYTGNGPQSRNSWYDIRNGGGYTYGYGYGGANNGYARGRERENNASASLSQPRSVHHLDSAGLDVSKLSLNCLFHDLLSFFPSWPLARLLPLVLKVLSGIPRSKWYSLCWFFSSGFPGYFLYPLPALHYSVLCLPLFIPAFSSFSPIRVSTWEDTCCLLFHYLVRTDCSILVFKFTKSGWMAARFPITRTGTFCLTLLLNCSGDGAGSVEDPRVN